MNNYRSKFEARFAANNPSFEYETKQLKYTIEHVYNPDFYDPVTDTYWETKGLWDAADRRKILAVLKQHPELKLVLIFQNPANKINKHSKTSYADWCDKHSIQWRKG